MTTITPYRSPVQDGRDGFGQLLHAEWTKFRTVRGWVIGMIVAILVTAGIGIFFVAASGNVSCGSVSSGGSAQTRHGAAACGQPPLLLGPGGEPVADSFYFVHQPLAGNGSITVRVTSLAGLPNGPLSGLDMQPGLVPWSKAGIIIKHGLGQGSSYAAMMVTRGNGVRMQWNYTGDTPGLSGAVAPASPRWLRLTRDGDTLTGYDSTDGAHWTRVGAVHLAGLPSAVQAGLFAASPGPLRAARASPQVASASATPRPPPSSITSAAPAHGRPPRGPVATSDPRRTVSPGGIARPPAGSP